jgi:hypothetical protein
MPVEDASGEQVEAPYRVPTHLDQHDSFGVIPTRVFFLGLTAFLLTQLALGVEKQVRVSPPQHWALLVVPTLLLVPFGLWFLSPPPEHGLVVWLRHLVRGPLLGPDQLQAYYKMRVADRVLYTGRGQECLTVWRLPTVNLDVASVAARRRHRGQWGAWLDGLGHEVTIAIRSKKLRRVDAQFRIYEQGSDEARALARWMSGHLGERPLITRERLLIIPAPDPQTLLARCGDIRASMAAFDWTPVEPETDYELERWINDFWPAHPLELDRLGPSMVQRGARDLIVDGEYVRVYALGAFPATIATNWWSHLTDADLPVDVSLYIAPQTVWTAKYRLDARYNLLHTSRPTHARLVALEQINALRLALETSRVKPFSVAITLALRAATREELKQLDARLRQRVRDRGNAKLQLLSWEQLEGFERVAPLGHIPLPKRARPIETGTLARTTPLASSTLQLPGGVPLGEAGNAPCLFWTRAGQKNAHMALYGGSGAGKGFLMRVYHSRKLFQHDICLWGIDNDVQHEYSGRFARYLHAQVPKIRHAEDVDQEPITRNSRVVIWDLSDCPEAEYGDAVVRIVDRMLECVEQHSMRLDFFVDEATDLLRHPAAASRIEQLIQKGRKSDIGVTLVTQLVTDWFGTDLGRRVHGLVDSWWCGQQNGGELDAVASVLRLTPEEKTKILTAAIGTGLLATWNGARRVWLDLRDKCSPEEYDMAHTTPRTALTERRRVHHIEALIEADHRNGHTKTEKVHSDEQASA